MHTTGKVHVSKRSFPITILVVSSGKHNIGLSTLLLLSVEDEGPDLDGLPVGYLGRGRRINEGGVWSQPGLGLIRIVALDEGNLVGLLVGQVIPTVVRVVLDLIHAWKSKELSCKGGPVTHTKNEVLTPLSVRIDNAADDEILRVEVTPVRQCKRLVCDGVSDRTPNVDDSDTSLQ